MIEYNVRMGDPETEVVLPELRMILLKSFLPPQMEPERNSSGY